MPSKKKKIAGWWLLTTQYSSSSTASRATNFPNWSRFSWANSWSDGCSRSNWRSDGVDDSNWGINGFGSCKENSSFFLGWENLESIALWIKLKPDIYTQTHNPVIREAERIEEGNRVKWFTEIERKEAQNCMKLTLSRRPWLLGFCDDFETQSVETSRVQVRESKSSTSQLWSLQNSLFLP